MLLDQLLDTFQVFFQHPRNCSNDTVGPVNSEDIQEDQVEICAFTKKNTPKILTFSLFIVTGFFYIRLEAACRLENCSCISFLDSNISSWSIDVGVWILRSATSEQKTRTFISVFVSVQFENYSGNVAHQSFQCRVIFLFISVQS